MRRTFIAALLLSFSAAVPAMAGTLYASAATSYDINSNYVNSTVSFYFDRGTFDGTEYEFDVLQVLQPIDNWTDVTWQDSGTYSEFDEADAHECYYTMGVIQQFDGASLVGDAEPQSDVVCAPERCMYVVWENWPNQMKLDAAGYAAVGDSYSWTAYDYPDLEFQYWDGNVYSEDQTISGVFDSTSFTAIAVYDYPPDTCDPADPTCAGGGGGDCDPFLEDCCDPITGVCDADQWWDPLVVKLENGPWRFTGRAEGVDFDLLGNGRKVRTGWTAKDAEIAFVALDRNGNGIIDDGTELFGNTTPVNGRRAPSGFDALAPYDANHDGVIDAADPVWSSLLLWIDRNHDGICQREELIRMPMSPITAIDPEHHRVARRDRSGNYLRYQGLLHMGNEARPMYDVYFATAH